MAPDSLGGTTDRSRPKRSGRGAGAPTYRAGRGRRAGNGALIPALTVLAIICVVAGGIALALHLTPTTSARQPVASVALPTTVTPAAAADSTAASLSTGSSSAAATNAPETEVPNVVGKPVTVAETVLTAAGFQVQTRVADSSAVAPAANTVVTQQPLAGARLAAGQAVIITYQPMANPSARRQYVVVIDAGHQAKADLERRLAQATRITKRLAQAFQPIARSCWPRRMCFRSSTCRPAKIKKNSRAAA